MPKLKLKPVVISVACAFSIAGCASLTSSKTGQPWTVQPAFSVNHAGPKADAMYRLGRFYQGQRRYAEAIAAYRQALAMDAGHADAQNGLGVIYAEQGHHDEAVKALQAAIAASPRAAYLQNNLGYVLLLQGSNEKAVEVLEEARRLEPGNAKVRDNLVIGYERLIEQRKAQRPVQLDPETAVAVEAESKSAQPSVEVRTAPDSDVKLVTVAPAVYELHASRAEAAGAQTKHGADLAAPAATVVHSERASAAPAYASDGHEVRVAGSPTPIQASDSATEAARSDKARQQELETFKVEVSNGNGVGGMAARVAGYLARFGVSTGRLTNDKTFLQPTTLIQYREGYHTQAARIGSVLPKEVPVVQADTLRSDIHVRVVLGRDVRNDVALVDAERSKLQLAAEASEQTAR